MSIFPPPPELEPAVSPDMLKIPYALGIWEWIVIVLLIVFIPVVILLARKLNKKSFSPPTDGQITKGRILELQSRGLHLRESSTELSLILRTYLSGKSQDPALFETQQEFNRRADAFSALPSVIQDSARALLLQMAELKYSSETSEDPQLLEQLFAQSLSLIDTIEANLANQTQTRQQGEAPPRPDKISFTR